MSVFKRKKASRVECPHCEDIIDYEDFHVVFNVNKTGCPDCIFAAVRWAIEKMNEEREEK